MTRETRDQLAERMQSQSLQLDTTQRALRYLARELSPDATVRWREPDGDYRYKARLFGAGGVQDPVLVLQSGERSRPEEWVVDAVLYNGDYRDRWRAVLQNRNCHISEHEAFSTIERAYRRALNP